MKADKCVILAVAIFALIIVGEVCTVVPGVHNYDSSAEWKDGFVEYSVSSSGTNAYDVVLTDNHGYVSTERLMIYVDDDYDGNYGTANGILPMRFMNQDSMYNELTTALRHRNFNNYDRCNDSGLASYLNGTMGKVGKGLFVGSFELPSSVYDGTDQCLLMEWVRNGGNLYWFGSDIGAFAKTSDGVEKIDDNEILFFGTEGCINREDNTGTKDTNASTKMLSLSNSFLRYGLDVGKVKSEFKFETGFSNNGYSTIGMVSLDKGSVCVFSESNFIYMYDDMGQIIAGKFNPHTEIVGHDAGSVKGTINGRMDVRVDDHHLYIYIGGNYTVHGRSY